MRNLITTKATAVAEGVEVSARLKVTASMVIPANDEVELARVKGELINVVVNLTMGDIRVKIANMHNMVTSIMCKERAEDRSEICNRLSEALRNLTR